VVHRFANAEAVEYFSSGLSLLETLPEGRERNLKEMQLRLARGGPLAALRGYEDPESLRCCARSEQLCELIGEGPAQLPALLGLTLYHMNRGHLPKVRAYSEALLAGAEPLGEAPLLVAGHMMRGIASLTTATVSEGCEHLSKAIQLAQRAELRPPNEAFEVDALTVAYCSYSTALVVAGKPESARAAGEMGMQRARQLGHPRTHGSALVNCAMAAHLLDDPEQTEAHASEFMERLVGRGFHNVECSARILGGWARARLGDASGIKDLEEGLRMARQRGALGGLVQFLFAAIDVYARSGQFERGFEVLGQAAEVIQHTGERVGYAPQLPLIRARLLWQSASGSRSQVEALLRHSIELWKRNQAPWQQLDAAILLAQVAKDADVRSEARGRLAELYDGFSEGLQTPRLRQAHALLGSLSA
jgi:hypothetical protein